MWNKKKRRDDENMLRNGGLLLEKRISYFNGKYSNLIRTFSAKDLQKATDNYNPKQIYILICQTHQVGGKHPFLQSQLKQ